MRQKEEALARGDQIDFKEVPEIAPLTLDDMQSGFWMMALFSVMAVLSFLIEQFSMWINNQRLSKLLTNE